jgi:site-specific recombinase XerD
MAGGEQLIPHFQKSLEDYRATYMAARNLAARSRKEYGTDVGQFLGYLQSVGVRRLVRVAPPHIEGFLAKLDQRRLAGVTRRRKLAVLRTFFGWLKSNGQIAANPATTVMPPQTEDKEPRVLAKEEYERLLAGVQKPRDRAIIQLLLQTGIRLSEIQRLTISDLNLPSRVMRDSLGTLRILGKGKKTRTVLLNSKACEAMAAWLQVRPKIQGDALFVSSRQRPLSPRQFQYLAAKYLTQASIRGASVHTLRHTFATHHIEMGTDLVTVQEFLGHRSLDTTKLYIGLAKKRQAQHIQQHAL